MPSSPATPRKPSAAATGPGQRLEERGGRMGSAPEVDVILALVELEWREGWSSEYFLG